MRLEENPRRILLAPSMGKLRDSAPDQSRQCYRSVVNMPEGNSRQNGVLFQVIAGMCPPGRSLLSELPAFSS